MNQLVDQDQRSGADPAVAGEEKQQVFDIGAAITVDIVTAQTGLHSDYIKVGLIHQAIAVEIPPGPGTDVGDGVIPPGRRGFVNVLLIR